MLDIQSKIVNVMLQLQALIDEQYEDNHAVQTAFNQLAESLDNAAVE